MTEEKQKIISDICPFYKEYGSCDQCNTDLDIDDPPCYFECMANAIINNGYLEQSEGEWVDEPHFAQRGLKGKYYVCSKCNVCVPTIVELPLNMWHYCPNCGAKMRGDSE